MTLINRAAMAYYMVRLRRSNSTTDASKLLKAQADYARELAKMVAKKDHDGYNKGLVTTLNQIAADCDWDAGFATWRYNSPTYPYEWDYGHGETAADVINKVKNRNAELYAIETQLIPRIC